MRQWPRIYRALFVAQFQLAAQYRVQSVLWLLFAVIRPVIFLAAWSAAAATQGGSIGEYDIGDFASYYVALTLVGQLTMSWNAYDFEYEVRQGKLAPKLLRPLHPLHYAIVENLTWKIVTLPALVPALVLIGWTFHARFSPEWWHLVLFVPSLVLAAALRFYSGWVVAALAFWTTRIHAIMHFYDRLSFLFGGQIAPLSLLPGALQALGFVLPFGYMLAVPAEILRGGPSLDQVVLLLLGQLAWLVVCCAGFAVIWRAGLRQFSAVGA
jgi:ABC-2 type transport system permease protein